MSPGGSGGAAVLAEGLRKDYGDRSAVDGLDLAVPAGRTFGFLGPNGAGKSTTIGMLCTLLRPSGGRARVAGRDVLSEPHEVRRRIGLVFQESTLDVDLTAMENLRFHADLFGIPRRQAVESIIDMLELVDLADRRDSTVRTFSGGMRRRLEIARGLLHTPRVLFLDEPTTGLDPQTRVAIWEHLHRLRREREVTVFLTTHHLEEAEHCDLIAIMDEGRLVAQGTPAELKAVVGADLVVLRTDDDEAAARAIRERLGLDADSFDADSFDTADLDTAGLDAAGLDAPSLDAAGLDADGFAPDRSPGGLRLRVPDGAAFVPRLCAAISVPVHSVTVTPPTLDDVFLHYTGRTIREADSGASPFAGIAPRR
ncbi:ATP-binding cassette domain-containing protein [Wenjunlia tyrosinilytica]|uniref:Daunorubicin resistance protein DrrA family ABC transporter ATP-binding protein n=1 Tax=Wenjunlia tyrosinilytica TaxID=1544741 RepID=A0A918DXX4_9ACTN|nr:ATP-binding cassette domain-containing protein [Wenjunlia tyrosinilytica]GGO87598.1 daunorubicin resistance protein DrrA family ABC transporter ATP-binding protein [Wenjunlia tyrosinilytica]